MISHREMDTRNNSIITPNTRYIHISYMNELGEMPCHKLGGIVYE